MPGKTVAPKQKNVAIEIWRFLIAIAIIGFHVGFIIARTCQGGNGYYLDVEPKWFFGSSEVLLIFTVTAGYFMMAHFNKRKDDKEYKERSATSKAFEYTWSRIKSLIPVLILGYIIAILVCTKFYYPDYNAQQISAMIVNSIWEFLGFHAAGLRSSGNEFFNLNGPLWFISAILIVGYFLYWALAKNEDFTKGVLAPFGFIFFAGWWSFTGTRASQTAWSTLGLQTASSNGMGGAATDATATLGFNNGLVFVLIGMLAGIIVYQLIEKIKEHKFNDEERFVITLVNVICSGLLLWYTIYQPTFFNLDRWTVAFLCIGVIMLSLLNEDYITKALNNKHTNKLFAYLGSISLYVYMLHYPLAIMIIKAYGHNSASTSYSFWSVFVPTAILSVMLSVVTKEVLDKTILKKKEN